MSDACLFTFSHWVVFISAGRAQTNTSRLNSPPNILQTPQVWHLSVSAQNATICCIQERIRTTQDSFTHAETVTTRSCRKTPRFTVTNLLPTLVKPLVLSRISATIQRCQDPIRRAHTVATRSVCFSSRNRRERTPRWFCFTCASSVRRFSEHKLGQTKRKAIT